jgi:hypothetical protein
MEYSFACVNWASLGTQHDQFSTEEYVNILVMDRVIVIG